MSARRAKIKVKPNIKPGGLAKAASVKPKESAAASTPKTILTETDVSKPVEVTDSELAPTIQDKTALPTETEASSTPCEPSPAEQPTAKEANDGCVGDQAVQAIPGDKDAANNHGATDKNIEETPANQHKEPSKQAATAKTTRRAKISFKPNIRPSGSKAGPITKPVTKPVSSTVTPAPNPTSSPAKSVIDKPHQLPEGSGNVTDVTDLSTFNNVENQAESAVTVSEVLPTDGDSHSPLVNSRVNQDPIAALSSPFKEPGQPMSMSPVTGQDAPAMDPSPAELPTREYTTLEPAVGPAAVGDGDLTVAAQESMEGSECESVSVMSEVTEPMEEGEEKVKIEKRIRKKSKKSLLEATHSKEKSPDRQKMKISDLVFWNPNANSLPAKKKKKKPSEVKSEGIMTTEKAALILDDDEDDESSNQSTLLPAPQIMIGPDGNIVLNTESTLIHSEKKEAAPTEIIEEDDDDRYLNFNSYRNTKKAKMWSDKETGMWLLGLSMCGTDFSLLGRLMPHRSRKDLKNKFRREERRNRPLIDQALANHAKYDPEPFINVAKLIEKPVKLVKVKAEKKPSKKVLLKAKGEATDANGDENSLQSVKKEKAQKEKAAKRKRPAKKLESEDEEDDWGPDADYDMEIYGEDLNPESLPTVKRKKSNVKAEGSPAVANSPETLRPGSTHETDVDPEPQPKSSSNCGGLAAIPGSTQVQIEMEGVQSPVQGVLIPSHMVPAIAPQLGIHTTTQGMQVLLVQEETPNGSLVHVYIIPEGETLASVGVGKNFAGGPQQVASASTGTSNPNQAGAGSNRESPRNTPNPSPAPVDNSRVTPTPQAQDASLMQSAYPHPTAIMANMHNTGDSARVTAPQASIGQSHSTPSTRADPQSQQGSIEGEQNQDHFTRTNTQPSPNQLPDTASTPSGKSLSPFPDNSFTAGYQAGITSTSAINSNDSTPVASNPKAMVTPTQRNVPERSLFSPSPQPLNSSGTPSDLFQRTPSPHHPTHQSTPLAHPTMNSPYTQINSPHPNQTNQPLPTPSPSHQDSLQQTTPITNPQL